MPSFRATFSTIFNISSRFLSHSYTIVLARTPRVYPRFLTIDSFLCKDSDYKGSITASTISDKLSSSLLNISSREASAVSWFYKELSFIWTWLMIVSKKGFSDCFRSSLDRPELQGLQDLIPSLKLLIHLSLASGSVARNWCFSPDYKKIVKSPEVSYCSELAVKWGRESIFAFYKRIFSKIDLSSLHFLTIKKFKVYFPSATYVATNWILQ